MSAPVANALLVVLLLASGCSSALGPSVGFGWCREGVPHGGYELRIVGGPTLIEGKLVDGKKHGVFTVYTTLGTRIAEIAYENGKMSGPVRMWYGDSAFPDAVGRLKLRASYVDGSIQGTKQVWYWTGAESLVAEYDAGRLVSAQAWGLDGGALSMPLARIIHDPKRKKATELLETGCLHLFHASQRPSACPSLQHSLFSFPS